jgi:hypothetical protein
MARRAVVAQVGFISLPASFITTIDGSARANSNEGFSQKLKM